MFSVKSMSSLSVRAVAVSAIALSVWGGGVAFAQAGDPPVSQEYHTAEWTFVPAKENGLTIGFLAWLSDVQPIGNNIRVIWFQQDGPTSWSSWVWTDIDKLEGARWVRDFIGDQQLLLEAPQLVNPDFLYLADPVFIQMAAADPSLLPTPVVDPQLMLNGCLSGDPTGQNILNSGGNVNTQAAGFVQTGCAMAPILSGWDLQPSVDPDHQENSYLVDVLIAMAADANENTNSVGNGLGNIGLCVCLTTYSGIIPTPPGTRTITSTVNAKTGRRTCVYTRGATALRTDSGEYYIFLGFPPCPSCNSGPTRVPGTETGGANVPAWQSCPPNPSGITTFSE